MKQACKNLQKGTPSGRERCPEERSSQTQGFSFVEMMVATVVLVLVGGSIATVMFQGQYSYQSQRGMVEVAQDGRIAMEQIMSFVRQAGNSVSGTITPISILGANHIRINADLTGSEAGNVGDPDGDTNDLYELVVVRHDVGNTRVMIDLADGGGERVLIENIAAGDFVISLLDAASIVTATEADIRAVRVEMKIRASDTDLQTGDVQSITLRSEAQIRSRSFQPF